MRSDADPHHPAPLPHHGLPLHRLPAHGGERLLAFRGSPERGIRGDRGRTRARRHARGTSPVPLPLLPRLGLHPARGTRMAGQRARDDAGRSSLVRPVHRGLDQREAALGDHAGGPQLREPAARGGLCRADGGIRPHGRPPGLRVGTACVRTPAVPAGRATTAQAGPRRAPSWPGRAQKEQGCPAHEERHAQQSAAAIPDQFHRLAPAGGASIEADRSQVPVNVSSGARGRRRRGRFRASFPTGSGAGRRCASAPPPWSRAAGRRHSPGSVR